MVAIARSNQGTSDVTQFPVPEEGNYVLELVKVSDAWTEKKTYGGKEKEVTRIWMDIRPVESSDTDDGEIEWIYDEGHEPDEGQTIRIWANLTLGSDEKPSTLRPFVKAWCRSRGEELDDEADYDIAEFERTRFKGTITHYKRNNGTLGANVESPIGIRPKTSKPKPATRKPDPEPDDEGPDWD